MRSALVEMPQSRSAGDQRELLRAAIRQLERADIYLAAVLYMDLDDREGNRALSRLRSDIEALRHHFIDLRAQT